jgi:hypothetical protein
MIHVFLYRELIGTRAYLSTSRSTDGAAGGKHTALCGGLFLHWDVLALFEPLLRGEASSQEDEDAFEEPNFG